MARVRPDVARAADRDPRRRLSILPKVNDVTDLRGGHPASDLLAASGELFGTSLDVEMTLSQLAELVVPRVADWAAVDVLDENESFRRVGVAHVDPAGVALLRELHERYPLRSNEGRLRGRVVATLEAIALYDIDERELRSLSRDKRHHAMLVELGIRSAMWVPLVVRDRVVGVLSAGYRDATRRYTPADLNLMRELARRAALAVDNALLYRAVKRAETRQAAIASLGQDALGGARYEDLAQSAAALLAQIMGVPLVEVLQLRPDNKLLLVAGVGWKQGVLGKATVKAGLGSQGGYTLATVGPVVLDDLATETRFRPPPLLVNHGVVSGLTVVIGSPQAAHGVLGAHTDHHRVFAEDDVSFLQTVANVLEAAIERQEDEDRLNRLAVAENARAAQLRAVIQSIGDAVVVCDVLGVVLLANPAAELLLGSQIADGLPGILGAFEWPPEMEVGDLKPGEGMELRMVESPDGPDRAGVLGDLWMELSAFPVLGGEEEVSASGGTILVLRDVTAARNARSVRDAFLGILSHELRTPVTTIYGGSEMLARRAGSVTEEERRDVFEDIRAEADRLYRLVENLLVLSHVERQGLQIDPEPVLLQRLIPRVIDSESGRWLSARFLTELPPGLPPVAAEETYLEQILRNLLGNAAKYGGQGPVVVTATDVGSAIRVTVADTGPGFPEDEKDRLFDLFYRSPSLSRTASGAGIGLFVSRQLIAAMSGRMWAVNRDGGGAEFGFELPIFPD
jgi:signal transduction histidine kinase